jgi:hypothetical protein
VAGKVPSDVGLEDGVSFANAATAEGREAAGIDQAKRAIRRSFGQSVDVAAEKEAQYPSYGARLVDKFSKGPAGADDVQGAALANELAKA